MTQIIFITCAAFCFCIIFVFSESDADGKGAGQHGKVLYEMRRALKKDSKFCLKCGAKIPAAEAVKIEEDGKGGLTIEAPEGSTVEISDTAPKQTKRKASSSRRKTTAKKPAASGKTSAKTDSKPGSSKLIFIAAAAVLLFTGFVAPGFFRSKTDPYEPSGYVPSGNNSGSGSNGGTSAATPVPKEEVILPEFNGNSKPFTDHPCEGITVSAKEDAFSEDTTVTITPLGEPPAYCEKAIKNAEAWGQYVIAGWEVDAGLDDSELIPGTYEVEINLAELGIDPETDDAFNVVRVAEDGSFYDYAAVAEDGKLTYSSQQNSVVLLQRVNPVLFIKGTFEDLSDKASISGYFLNKANYLGVFYIEKRTYSTPYGSYEIHFLMDEFDPEHPDKAARMHERMAEIEKGYKEKAAAEAEAKYSDKTWFTRKWQESDIYSRYLKKDSEYQELVKQAELPEVLSSTKECIDKAYSYLGGVAKVRMPSKRVVFIARTDDYEGDNRSLLGQAEKKFNLSMVNLWPNKSKKSQEDADNYLLTITHELFHVCQEGYRFDSKYADRLTDDPRFDEMVTMVLERDAKDYFIKKGIITTDPVLTEKKEWFLLRIPVDGEPEGVSAGESFNMLMRQGYHLGDFIMYLQEQYPSAKVTPHKLMLARNYLSRTGVSGPVREAFGMTEEEFNLYYRKWVIAHRDVIAVDAVPNFVNSEYKAQEWIDVAQGDIHHVNTDIDGSYFTSLKGFRKGRGGGGPCILVFDKGFRKNHPDVNLLPIDKNYSSIENGVYFKSISQLILAEIHGISSKSEDASVGYTLYSFDKTPSVKLSDDDDKLYVQFPEVKGAAKAGVVEGYQLTITEGGTTVLQKEYSKEKFGQTISIDKSILFEGRLGQDPMTASVTICEYVKSNKGKLCMGIASDPVTITIKETGNKTDIKEQTYSNIPLYYDTMCGFDSKTITEDIQGSGKKISEWPKNNSVHVKGDEVTVVLDDYNFTYLVQTEDEEVYDDDDTSNVFMGHFEVKETMTRSKITVKGKLTAQTDSEWSYQITDCTPTVSSSLKYTITGTGGGNDISENLEGNAELSNIRKDKGSITLEFKDGQFYYARVELCGDYYGKPLDDEPTTVKDKNAVITIMK